MVAIVPIPSFHQIAYKTVNIAFNSAKSPPKRLLIRIRLNWDLVDDTTSCIFKAF